jgi:beta-glucosidase
MKSGFAAFAAGLVLLIAGTAFAQPATSPAPWMNTTLSPDARADLVLGQMTQDEQLQLVEGYFGIVLKLPFLKPIPKELRPLLPGASGFVPGIPRLGIPALAETDAGVGVANNMHMRPGDQATALPSGLLMAATWNPTLAYQAGAVIGREAHARGFNVVLGGAINLAREPRGGRTFEYAGEDPLLAGTIVGEAIRGTQSESVISTTKHFALNDQENGRGILNVGIDPAAARESDLLAFEIAIEHGAPGAVMCSYNSIAGTHACENANLLNDTLKRDWAYPGFVLSDWGGVHSTADAANNGLDQESASGFDRTEYFGAPLKQALAAGAVTPARLHDMVHRILRSMFANGLFDAPAAKDAAALAAAGKADISKAQRAAEEGIVLLKNDGNLLPLAAKARTIAIIGAHADIGMLSGAGSSQVVPIGDNPANEYPVGGRVFILPNGAPIWPLDRKIYDPPSPLAALKLRAPQTRFVFDDGADPAAAAKAAQSADIAIVFAEQWMHEGEDVPNLSLPGAQDALIAAVAAANPHTVVVLETGGPVLMPWLAQVPAVVEAWYAGNNGAAALARVLYGDVDASGRLPLTFPQSEQQLPRPAFIDFDAARVPFDVTYNEGADAGYRWFEKTNAAPLFPFGYGLSYTHFTLANFKTDGASASVDVTNEGAREGRETVELYATPPGGVARLVGFAKVDLKPGETATVPLAIEPRLLAHFDMASDAWVVAAGNYAFAVGESSAAMATTSTVILPARTLKP